MARTFRIKFNRIGPMCYTGHLDMMRYMQKAVMRAGLDVTYSKGYHPHQIMSFAYPLGVGMETHGDYVDLDLNSYQETIFEDEKEYDALLISSICSQIKDDFNRVLEDGTSVLSVSLVPDKALNAMASVSAASYTVSVDDCSLSSENINDFLKQETIVVRKEGKKGDILKDIKPGIFELHLCEPGKIYMLLNSGSSLNIKPADLVLALEEFLGKEAIKITHIIREDTLRLENDKLVPLGYD